LPVAGIIRPPFVRELPGRLRLGESLEISSTREDVAVTTAEANPVKGMTRQKNRGRLQFGQLAKRAIVSQFEYSLAAKAVGFSRGDFSLIVQALPVSTNCGPDRGHRPILTRDSERKHLTTLGNRGINKRWTTTAPLDLVKPCLRGSRPMFRKSEFAIGATGGPTPANLSNGPYTAS